MKRNRTNPVAKHAHKFNRAAVHRDRTKYERKAKHSKHSGGYMAHLADVQVELDEAAEYLDMVLDRIDALEYVGLPAAEVETYKAKLWDVLQEFISGSEAIDRMYWEGRF